MWTKDLTKITSTENAAEQTRKFGPTVGANSLCADCGRSWGNYHTGYWCFSDSLPSSWETTGKYRSVWDRNWNGSRGYFWLGPATVSAATSTQQEEKVFQVSEYSFSSGAVTNSAFKTLEEAQAFLEQRAATYAASNSVAANPRSFYTLSLLNVKTGKYLGFTQSLPPTVTLSGASAAS